MISSEENNKPRVLVLGHTGFLGKAVFQKLKNDKISCSGASLSTGVDIREPNSLDKLIADHEINVIINCAAVVGGIEFGITHPVSIYRDNTLMTLSILDSASRFNTRLINPISNCAYPRNATIFTETEFWDGPLDESVLVYGSARKFGWIGAWAYAQEMHLDSVNLVFPNMYGPGDHLDPIRAHALGALVYRFLQARENNLPEVAVWGSGNPVREWMYIDDAVNAMYSALYVQPSVGIVNVGSGEGISIKDLALEIASQVGYLGKVVFDSKKLDGAPYKTMNGVKGKELLKWEPKMPLRDGIRKTIDWYAAQMRTTT